MGSRCFKYSASFLYSNEGMTGKKDSGNPPKNKIGTQDFSLRIGSLIAEEKLASDFRKRIKRSEGTTSSKESIKKFYTIDPKKLGSGHFGVVRLVRLKSNNSRVFALKSIDLSKFRDRDRVLRELEILRTLDHPNIIKFHETYIEQNSFHIVMEYCSGGELFERLFRAGKLSEATTRELMRKVFSAVRYLHERDVCHRDLKPENFLFVDKSEDADIKIIDFGLAKYINGVDSLKTIVGTPLYIAPEVLKGQYDKSCDNWSLGVILYFLLSGVPPFHGHTNEDIFNKINTAPLVFRTKDWRGISKQAQDLISCLIVRDPKKRYTSEQALAHSWFQTKQDGPLSDEVEHLEMDPKIICLLKEFRSPSLFKREVLRVMVNLMKNSEIKKLNQAFRLIDFNNTGTISFDSLKKVMDELGVKGREEEIRRIIQNIDADDNYYINYTDFIAATLDRKYYLNKQRLWEVFKYFDVEDSQSITLKNLANSMARMGRKVAFKDLEAMIKEVDKSKLGKICFQDFADFMRVEGPSPALESESHNEPAHCERIREFRFFRTPPSLGRNK